MAELNTEEEQIDALKRWWKANGTSLIAGIVLAVAGVLGWEAWQDYQANQATTASLRYQQLVSLAGQATAQDDTDVLAQARPLVEEIVDEHGGTLYADLAVLLQARLAVAADDRESARKMLETFIATTDRDYLKGLARLRLARLQLAGDEAETALTTLDAGTPEALAAQSADLRGDILVKLSREDQAREAYQRALTLSQEAGQPIHGLQLKLDNLGAEDATL